MLNDEKDRDKLLDFCQNEYKSILDDYILKHINQNDHDKTFDLMISKGINASCAFDTSKFSIRHSRDKRKDEYENFEEANLSFYVDFMDQTHCYSYHLYDTGMGIRREQLLMSQDDDKDDEDYAKLTTIIRQKTRRLQNLGIYSDARFLKEGKVNKFALSSNISIDEEESSATTLDGYLYFV